MTRAHGKHARMRGQIARAVAEGKRVLYVGPDGARVITPGDPLIAGLEGKQMAVRP